MRCCVYCLRSVFGIANRKFELFSRDFPQEALLKAVFVFFGIFLLRIYLPYNKIAFFSIISFKKSKGKEAYVTHAKYTWFMKKFPLHNMLSPLYIELFLYARLLTTISACSSWYCGAVYSWYNGINSTEAFHSFAEQYERCGWDAMLWLTLLEKFLFENL